VFLTQSRPKNAFLVEYYGELITAEEGYSREAELGDDSVFRYFLQFKRKQLWCVALFAFFIVNTMVMNSIMNNKFSKQCDYECRLCILFIIKNLHGDRFFQPHPSL